MFYIFLMEFLNMHLSYEVVEHARMHDMNVHHATEYTLYTL